MNLIKPLLDLINQTLEFLLNGLENFVVDGGFWGVFISYIYSKKKEVFQGYNKVMKNDFLRSILFTPFSILCFYLFYEDVFYYIPSYPYDVYALNVYTWENFFLLFIGLTLLVIGNKNAIKVGFKQRLDFK